MRETQRPRSWQWAWMILAAVLIAGFSAPTAFALAPSDPGPSEEDVPSDLDIHFRDERDAGDDPFKPGCHYHFGDKTCRAAKMIFFGDYCAEYFLFEWTNTRCHEPEDDKKVYDCRELCAEKGMKGTCVTVEDFCRDRKDMDTPGEWDSARCECKPKE